MLVLPQGDLVGSIPLKGDISIYTNKLSFWLVMTRKYYARA